LPGDDLFGLQAVLFEAGVWGVLGTLWPVDDETAPELMADVHRAYAAGQAPDEALQTAIRTHLRTPGRRKSAFYWAPFVLTTMGRQAVEGGRSPARHSDEEMCRRAG
jgi:CHAT domain-containing protein